MLRYLAFISFIAFAINAYSQVTEKKSGSEDSVQSKNDFVNEMDNNLINRDSINLKIDKASNKINHILDSVKRGGSQTEIKRYKQKLDSLQRFPDQQYTKLISEEKKIRQKLLASANHVRDSIQNLTRSINNKLNDVNQVSSKVGLGQLGKNDNSNLLSGASQMPLTKSTNNQLLPILGGNTATTGKLPVNTLLNGVNSSTAAGGLGKISEITNNVSGVTNEIKQVSSEVKKYSRDARSLNKDSVLNSKKLSSDIEKKAGELSGLKSIEGNRIAMEAELKRQQKLIEDYKKEMVAKDDIEMKVKELTNSDQLKNLETKSNDKVKDFNKYKRKYSEVQDIRNLPKHATNPMTALPWRERIVPGFTFQTFSQIKNWIELSPQAYYKLNGYFTAGAAYVYRFSIDVNKISFNDFGALTGGRFFITYGSVKGFSLRGELSYVNWNPQSLYLDKEIEKQQFTSAIGILKSFTFTEKVKGNMQALYHYSWKSPDPYISAFEIRFGMDFSFKKKKFTHRKI